MQALLDDLVDSGDLDDGTKVYGVAQQVVHQGYDSLSPKQRYVLKEVGPLLEERGEEDYWARARQARRPS